jgi:hypothetical protein
LLVEAAVCGLQDNTGVLFMLLTTTGLFGLLQYTVWPPVGPELAQEAVPTQPVSVVWHWVAVPTE